MKVIENYISHSAVRKYEPSAGRFLSIDPLWETPPAQYPGRTTYNYCGNDTVNKVDVTGLEDIPVKQEVGNQMTPITCNENDTTMVYTECEDRDATFNCITYATHPNQPDLQDPAYDPNRPLWDENIDNNLEKYTPLSFNEKNIPGEIVIYYNATDEGAIETNSGSEAYTGGYSHVGVVVGVDKDENANVLSSKLGAGKTELHHPIEIPKEFTFFKDCDTSPVIFFNGGVYITRQYFKPKE